MGIGPWELVVILVIVVIVFGVGKLPEVGSGLGEGIRNFKKALGDTKSDTKSLGDTKSYDVTPPPLSEEKRDENK